MQSLEHTARALVTRNPKDHPVNKSNTRDAKLAQTAVELGMPDMAARILSACHRASMRKTDQTELLALAVQLGVSKHPEFIIC